MTVPAHDTPQARPRGRRARIIGRAARLITGILLLAVSLPFFLGADSGLVLRTLSVVGALVVGYSLVHFLVATYLPDINRWLGAALANTPAIAVYVLGSSGGPIFGAGEGQLATLTYVGASLLLAGLRGDPGCEVMSVPGLLFGRRTHLACIVFSPLDWLEEKAFAGK